MVQVNAIDILDKQKQSIKFIAEQENIRPPSYVEIDSEKKSVISKKISDKKEKKKTRKEIKKAKSIRNRAKRRNALIPDFDNPAYFNAFKITNGKNSEIKRKKVKKTDKNNNEEKSIKNNNEEKSIKNNFKYNC